MPNEDSFSDLLQKGGQELGLDITKNQVKLFREYMNLLLDWNRKINLTAITEVGEVIIKHFLDSLTLMGKIDVKLQARIVDVGTGAGFPGVPLKIYRPDLRVALIDSLMKRLKFLEMVKTTLNLQQTEINHGRAEDWGRKEGFRDSFDYAVSRAVAKMPVLLEYNLPLVKAGGFFIAYKGPEEPERAPESLKAAAELGAELERVVKVQLPFSGDNRKLFVFRKKANTPEKYPRKPGIPEKKPLGI